MDTKTPHNTPSADNAGVWWFANNIIS